MSRELVELVGNRMRVNFHPGQMRAWNSQRRVVAVIAGTQSGKTCFGPHWLWREIQRCGPGDYMVVTPTFPLLELKALPEFRRLFEEMLTLGQYTGSPVRRFAFSPSGQRRTFGDYGRAYQTVVYFGYAAEPESLESATARAAWLDEAGQKRFKLASWEAVQRRLSIHQGRTLITTTPYNLGWLKQQIYDPWMSGSTEIDVVRFESIQNPAFPQAEYERARENLPRWKFDMFYRAMFSRPAGLIYDAFDEQRHVIPPFAIPDHWPRYLGLDFGGVHTAGIFYAREPETGRLFAYREYRAGSRTAAEHVRALLEHEPMIPICVGGSKSEEQWRQEFAAAGLPVGAPTVHDVELGIDRVYGAHRRDQILVFRTLRAYLDEKLSYSRAVDDSGQPTDQIEDKEQFHLMDAERYIVSWLMSNLDGRLFY